MSGLQLDAGFDWEQQRPRTDSDARGGLSSMAVTEGDDVSMERKARGCATILDALRMEAEALKKKLHDASPPQTSSCHAPCKRNDRKGRESLTRDRTCGTTRLAVT